MLEIGSLVDGKYKILNKIGQGGMSVVYLAMNEKANKQWAIKEIRKDGVSNYEVVKQGLIVETDLLKKLNHPNLPSIVDVIDRDDTFLIVMDYIEGNSLSKIVKHQGALPQEDVVEWAKQLCDVLGYLHSREPAIIYRDMKPANVMLKPDGNVTLIDFGTAREFKETSVADTTCLGTRGYAAPEQFGGQGQTDARTDIYCLGATLYHLLTGHNPAEPPYEMYPIRKWNPLLSSGLEQIIAKCTQQNPEDRYQSCAELMYDLQHYKELDIESQKQYRKSWRIFVGSCVMTVMCLAGAVGCYAAQRYNVNQSYDSHMEKAEDISKSADDKEQVKEALDEYINAINVDATRVDAYHEMLKFMFNNGLNNKEIVKEYLKYFPYDNSNLKKLKKKSENSYALIMYEIGLVYFLCDDEGDEQISSRYFDELKNDELDLTGDYKKISDKAESLNAIILEKDKSEFLDKWNRIIDERKPTQLGREDKRKLNGIAEEVLKFDVKNIDFNIEISGLNNVIKPDNNIIKEKIKKTVEQIIKIYERKDFDNSDKYSDIKIMYERLNKN